MAATLFCRRQSPRGGEVFECFAARIAGGAARRSHLAAMRVQAARAVRQPARLQLARRNARPDPEPEVRAAILHKDGWARRRMFPQARRGPAFG